MSEEEPGQRKQKRSRRDQLTPEQMQQAAESKRSYWPFVLAVAVFIALAGIEIHPIVVGIGAVLAIVAIIGWGLEHH